MAGTIKVSDRYEILESGNVAFEIPCTRTNTDKSKDKFVAEFEVEWDLDAQTTKLLAARQLGYNYKRRLWEEWSGEEHQDFGTLVASEMAAKAEREPLDPTEAAIRKVAKDLHMPVEEVRPLYLQLKQAHGK